MRCPPLLFLAVLLYSIPTTGLADDDRADLASTLRPIREQHGVPALAAGVWREGKIVATGATGLRRIDKDSPVSGEDRWHVGSCAKAMTATLAAVLVHDGAIRWESTVGEVLGDEAESADEAWGQVTLEQLLNHRGGAPGQLPEFAFALRGQDLKRSRKALVRRLLRDRPRDVGDYRYSDAGYVIAGRMLEVAGGGELWERLLWRRVLEPLGIRSAAFGAPGMPGRPDQPRGHRADGTPLEPTPWADNPLACGPAGTVNLTVSDWLTFVAQHVRTDPQAGPLHLPPDLMLKLHAADQRLTGHAGYGFGWVVTPMPGDRAGVLLSHDGSNGFWHASVLASPGESLAIVAVTNQGGDAAQAACRDAIAALLKQYRPTETARKRGN